MIKVIHYLRHLGLGGTEKTCQLFFQNLNPDEFKNYVVYEKSGSHPRLDEFIKSAKICNGELIEIDSYGDSKTPSSTELQKIINTINPDILHVYRSGYIEFPEKGIQSYPNINIDVKHFVETNVFGFFDQNPNIDRSLFMSEWLMKYCIKNNPFLSRSLFYANRLDYINNPVELPYCSDVLPIKDTWGKDAIILGRVGRPENGIYNDINVKAANILRLQGYDVRFLVVAPPENMVKDLEFFDIPYYQIPPTTDPMLLSKAYNTMDIYAHARADGETFGVNIAEAMIHKLPVVTHVAVPSHPQMGVFQSQTTLVDDNINGFIVNNDACEYAEALIKLLNKDTRRKMGLSAFEKALKEYHVIPCTEKLQSIYKSILNGKN